MQLPPRFDDLAGCMVFEGASRIRYVHTYVSRLALSNLTATRQPKMMTILSSANRFA